MLSSQKVVLEPIDQLKHLLATSSLQPIDYTLPLTVETDASEFSVATTLNQKVRAVAFILEQTNNAVLQSKRKLMRS